MAEPENKPTNFIRHIVDADLKAGSRYATASPAPAAQQGRRQQLPWSQRLRPRPCQSICLNFPARRATTAAPATCSVPIRKEEQEYVDSISSMR